MFSLFRRKGAGSVFSSCRDPRAKRNHLQSIAGRISNVIHPEQRNAATVRARKEKAGPMSPRDTTPTNEFVGDPGH